MSQNNTEVRKSPLGGNGLFAVKSLSPGDVSLSLDRPLIAVLDRSRIEDTCSWCFAWTELPLLSGAGVGQASKVNWCTGCKRVKYCGKACQSRAWKAGHKWECKVFASQPEPIPNTIIAVMQLVHGFEVDDARFKPILDMQSHRDDFQRIGGKKWDSMRLMAHTALKFLGAKENSPKFEQTMTAICILMCNSSRLVAPTFDPMGLTFDPLVSKINHSCSPNAVVVYDGPHMSVRVLCKMKKDDEILISYVDNSAPFGVRQAELQDQYFFTCSCTTCKLRSAAPQDSFRTPGPDFESRIQVIDDMIPQLKDDPAWGKHVLGDSKLQQRLSALQFYAYSYLVSPDAASTAQDVERLRKAIIICRNSGVFPLAHAPLPALYQQYFCACMMAKRYNEALIAMMRIYFLIDPSLYPQPHHPVRVVHAWALATLANAVGSEQGSPFCEALKSCEVDLSMLFLGLLMETHEQVGRSHGRDSKFGLVVEGAWRAMMEPGGELDVQYSQRGVDRAGWQRALEGQVKGLMPKVKKFVEDENIAAQMDEAMAG